MNAAKLLGITTHPDPNYHLKLGVFCGAALRKRKDPDAPTEGEIMKMSDSDPEKIEWLQAMDKEIEDTGVKHECFIDAKIADLPKGEVPISSHFIFKQKRNTDGGRTRKKARLVGNGNMQKWGPHDGSRYAPTGRPESSMFFFALAAWFNIPLEGFDVSSAFLYPKLAKKIYMWLPKCMNRDGFRRLVLLLKAIYGLGEAPKLFNEHITKHMLSDGRYTQLVSDRCVFTRWSKDRKRFLFALLHVDDCKILSNSETYKQQFKAHIMEKYEITYSNRLTEYCGIKAEYTPHGGLELSQNGLVDKIIQALDVKKTSRTPYITPSPRPASTPVDAVQFLSVVGMLLYLCQRTRPDVAYITSRLSSVAKAPQPEDARALRRVGEYLLETRELRLSFLPETPGRKIAPKDLHTIFHTVELHAYADAAFMSSYDSKSHSGIIITLGKFRAALQAISSKQKRVTVSSTESEHEVIYELIKLLMWWRAYLEELGFPQTKPTVIYEDNKSTIHLCENDTKHSKQSKHYLLRIHFVHEQVVNKTIELEYLETTKQIADLLTKALSEAQFTYLRDIILGRRRSP